MHSAFNFLFKKKSIQENSSIYIFVFIYICRDKLLLKNINKENIIKKTF